MPSTGPSLARRFPRRIMALGLIAAFSGLARADGPRGADWIADDAIAIVEVTRPVAVFDQLTGATVRSVLAPAPSYRRYIESGDYRKARAAADAVAGDLGTTWDRGLLDLIGGGLVLAIEPGPAKPRAVLVATPRDPSFPPRLRETLRRLARLDATINGKPDPVKTADHRGVEFDKLGPDAAFAILDGAVVFAESEPTLRLVIDRSKDGLGGHALAENPDWKARRPAQLAGDASAWALLRVDRLRKLDPTALVVPERVNPLATLLFGSWVESLRKAPWIAANLTWTDDRLAATLTLPTPPGGYSETYRRFAPAEGKGAPAPAWPKGAILSVALARDLASLWEVRSDLFTPAVVQGLTQLDTTAGTFFGGRDFGSGVLGALGFEWRLVVARQDVANLDPVPADKYPAVALVTGLRPEDEEFSVRLMSAFQSFVGLINLGAAQSKAPPLMLGSEDRDGSTIATARFIKPRKPEAGPVDPRYNLSPSAARVGDRFILSTALGLARDLLPALKATADAPAAPATLRVEADGASLAALIDENRDGLVMRNMLEKGNDRPGAEVEVDFLSRLARTLNRGSFAAEDKPDEIRFRLEFKTRRP